MNLKTEAKRSGFVLVVTLMFSLVTAMMLTAAIALLPGGRMMSRTIDSNQQALHAAEAGVEYARTRLQENPGWRGDADAVTVDLPNEFWVRESRGNVVGILWDSDGRPSMFKLRFNYQNGGGSPDEGFGDPPSDMEVESIYVSENNLSGSTSAPLYRADSSDFEVSSSVAGFDVPKYAAVVYSEGFAGQGLRNVSPTQLDPDTSAGEVTGVTVEAILGRDASKYGDSVLYGARDVLVDISGEFLVESEDSATPPRARSMGDVSVVGGGSDPVTMTDGEVFVKPGTGRFTVNSLDSTDPVATQADSSAEFLQLGWDEIDKASSSGPRLPAGTYVWRPGGVLDYYAQEFDPVAGPPSTAPDASYTSTGDLPASASGAVELTPASMEVTFAQDVYVEANGSATGLAIVAEPGLVGSVGFRPEVDFNAPAPDDPSPILTAPGALFLGARVRGDGSLTSENDITFEGESVLEASADNRVAIYSKQDINVLPVPDAILPTIAGGGGGPLPAPGASATPGGGGLTDFFPGTPPFGIPAPQDVAFGGVVYAQGNFNVDTGSDANFYLHGVLVAYGGDSAVGEMPGARAGAGFVNMTAGNVQLVYDSSYVANLRDQNGATKLDVVSWRRR